MNQVSATPGSSVLTKGARQTIVFFLLLLFYLTCLLHSSEDHAYFWLWGIGLNTRLMWVQENAECVL